MAKDQNAGGRTAAGTAAFDLEKTKRFSTTGISYDLVEGWDITEVLWRMLRDAGELDRESLLILSELKISYYRCDFETALGKADYLIENAEAPIAMYARAMRMLIMVASGDGDRAYEDYLVLKKIVTEGLSNQDDVQLFSASVISALRIESVLMESVFNLPDIEEGIDEIPIGLKLYFGYLLAMRYLRRGCYHEAYGIALSYQTVVNMYYPGARTYLHCIEASAKILMGDVERARLVFNKAWELKDEFGILMPFIELNYALLGLPRINRAEVAAPEEVRRVDALLNSFRKGWYGLRQRCGLSFVSEPLTPIESYTSGLAALGWRNKEIAKHLLLSESTVKHTLTSAYKKLNVSNRAELQKLYQMPSRKFEPTIQNGEKTGIIF